MFEYDTYTEDHITFIVKMINTSTRDLIIHVDSRSQTMELNLLKRCS